MSRDWRFRSLCFSWKTRKPPTFRGVVIPTPPRGCKEGQDDVDCSPPTQPGPFVHLLMRLVTTVPCGCNWIVVFRRQQKAAWPSWPSAGAQCRLPFLPFGPLSAFRVLRPMSCVLAPSKSLLNYIPWRGFLPLSPPADTPRRAGFLGLCLCLPREQKAPRGRALVLGPAGAWSTGRVRQGDAEAKVSRGSGPRFVGGRLGAEGGLRPLGY